MKKISEELFDEIKGQKIPLMIYGAGEVASVCLLRMMLQEIDVIGVAVTSMDSNPVSIWGKPVYSIESIPFDCENVIVLIALLEDKQGEIEETLHRRGINAENIYGMTDSFYHEWRESNYEVGRNSQNTYYRRYIEPYRSTLWRISVERAMSADERNSFMRREMTTLMTEELCLSRLVVVLGTKCSLRCKDCNNLMPYFKHQEDINEVEIVKSLEQITKKVGKILKCELIGGEPFLANNLKGILKYVLQNEKIEGVEITSNGMILPKKEVIESLQNSRVLVRISDYGKRINQTSMINFCKENGIRYQILGSENWVSPGGVEKRYKDAQTLKKEYENCSSGYMCKTLYKNRIFACARAASLYNLGFMREPESIPINENFKAEYLKKFILREFSIACDYCDIEAKDKKYVEAAIQMK